LIGEIVGEIPEWLNYDLPAERVGLSWQGKWRGQTQKWFALRFLGQDDDIRLDAEDPPEFDAWGWRPLAETPAEAVDTTLLIHPHALDDFLDFNDFLDVAEDAVERLGLDGVLQVASFHPQYRFADTRADDVTNCTNRSPYPTLHLLREASIDAAVAAFPEADEIYLRNMETLRRLGAAGWAALGLDPARNTRRK